MITLFLSLLLFNAIINIEVEAANACPCSNATLCNPIQLGPRKELFAFQFEPDLWQYYDWSLVTTFATFGSFDPQMVCKAHENNARLVLATAFPISQLYNQTAIQEWVESEYQNVVSAFADGVNIDIEDALDAKDAPALTNLVANISKYFHDKNPYYQVTYDVAWSPNCIDLRCYDYAGISAVVDFVIMMDYDMRSQIFGACVASANSPPNLVIQGFNNFTKLGIPADKLVLGLPWYGYDYPCTAVSEDGTVCQIVEVPFRGVNCSDAAGTERAYSVLMNLLGNSSTTGEQWSDDLQSPWFNYKDTAGKIHQVWYDNAVSLKIKTGIAKDNNMRGVGMWTGDFVAYQQDPQSAADIWAAMGYFFS